LHKYQLVGLDQLGDRQTEVHFGSQLSEGRVFKPHSRQFFDFFLQILI
jgi:hypothetical protein